MGPSPALCPRCASMSLGFVQHQNYPTLSTHVPVSPVLCDPEKRRPLPGSFNCQGSIQVRGVLGAGLLGHIGTFR